jgi:hypothetical protein
MLGGRRRRENGEKGKKGTRTEEGIYPPAAWLTCLYLLPHY